MGYNLAKSDSKKSTIREYIEAFAIAILLALFIRTFIIQAFKIPSGSMLPTLQIGDHLLVSKFIYGVKIPFSGTTLIPFKTPKHGDVVVFKYPEDRSIDYIKRIIGVPGDTIAIKNKKVFINNKAIEDPHAFYKTPRILRPIESPRDNFPAVKVPPGKVFVMGDNRDNSHDSRFWGFVDQKDILGKAFIIYWSWDIKKDLFSLQRFTSVRWTRIADIIH